MRKMIPSKFIEWIKSLKDKLIHNVTTNTTEVGGNLEVDGKLTCQGGEDVITGIQAVIDEGKPQLNLKQGEEIVGICDLSPVISGGSGGLKSIFEMFETEQTDATEFMILNKNYEQVYEIVANNINCGFIDALQQTDLIGYPTHMRRPNQISNSGSFNDVIIISYFAYSANETTNVPVRFDVREGVVYFTC